MLVGYYNPWDPDNDWHREVEEAQRAADEAKAPKAFQHRTMPESRCPTCALRVRAAGRVICEASGETINEASGVGACAWLPVNRDG